MPILQEIEPMIPSERSVDASALPELVQDLIKKSWELKGMVCDASAEVITEHMRIVNSYYSNLIEGNRTHPREIKRAMAGDYSDDPVKRDLQKESLAHIHTQRWLATLELDDEHLLSEAFIRDIHETFYRELPESLRTVEDRDQGLRQVVEPGVFRTNGQEVVVGRHLPPEASRLGAFMDRFKEAYDFTRARGQKRVIAAVASHHRLAWIHPFPDGNGRVGRLLTDLLLHRADIGACGIWCLSRGLARSNASYKAALADADSVLQGNGDGRGGLSEKALVAFCEFMLRTAIDQVEYIRSVLDVRGMERRIKAYIDDRNKGLILGTRRIKPEAAKLMEKAFVHGEIRRNEIADISGLGHAVTKKLVQQMKEEGLLTETSSRSPLRWAIPEHAERYYFPELAPV